MRHLWSALGAAVFVAACIGEQRDTSVAVAGEDAYYWSSPSLAVSASGIAVAWTAYENMPFLGVRVARYEGGAWTQLGDLSLIELASPDPEIAFTPDGTLLLKTEEVTPLSDLRWPVVVRRWTGTAWEPLGGTEVLRGEPTREARMALDSLGAPVIAAEVMTADYGQTSAIALRRWDGAAWLPLPSGDFDGSGDFVNNIVDLSRFALDSSDRPLLLYERVHDAYFSDSVLARWDGAAWTRPLSTPASIVDLAVDSGGGIWGLLEGSAQELRVSRFDGTSWTTSPPIGPLDADVFGSVAMDIDASGRAVVAWHQVRLADRFRSTESNAHVQRWTGEAWVPVLGPLYSNGPGSFMHDVQLAFGGPYQAEPVVTWIGGMPVTTGTAAHDVFVRVPVTSD